MLFIAFNVFLFLFLMEILVYTLLHHSKEEKHSLNFEPETGLFAFLVTTIRL